MEENPEKYIKNAYIQQINVGFNKNPELSFYQ